MRGTWVGAVCSWCHCPLESGRTLPLPGDATQPLRLTPRAEVATAPLLLHDNSRETSTEKRKKREEKEGAHHRKTSPTPLPRGWNVTPAAWKNSQCNTGLRGALACWPSGSGTGSCLLFTDTEPLVELL